LKLSGFACSSIVIECAGQFAWEIYIVIDNLFKVHLGHTRIGEKYFQRRLKVVFEAIRQLMKPKVSHRKPIGFRAKSLKVQK